MVWFVLTARVLPSSYSFLGIPKPSTNSFCLLPAFGRWSNAIPISRSWHTKGHMARKVAIRTWKFQNSKIFGSMAYFSWALTSSGAARRWGGGCHICPYNQIFYTEVRWKAKRFNLHRDQPELLLTQEEHRNGIEIVGRSYTLNLHFKK